MSRCGCGVRHLPFISHSASRQSAFLASRLVRRCRHYEIRVDLVPLQSHIGSFPHTCKKYQLTISRRNVKIMVARWQNWIPSFSWIAPGWRGMGAQSKERKGSNFAVQRSRAIVLRQWSESLATMVKITNWLTFQISLCEHLAGLAGYRDSAPIRTPLANWSLLSHPRWCSVA